MKIMNDISKQTVRKIKRQNIVPRSRRYFLLKHSAIWGLFGLSIILGSIASGVIMFQLKNAEWGLYRHFRHSLIEFIFLMIPYIWALFLLGFSGAAYYYFRRTSKGYRYRTVTVVVLSILLSIAGGCGLHNIGVSERLESIFADALPFYKGFEAHRKQVWMSPENGLLAGKIIKVLKDDKISIEDLDGKIWLIDVADTIWRGRLAPAPALEIKMIGDMTGENGFTAYEVRPWHGRRKHRSRHHQITQ